MTEYRLVLLPRRTPKGPWRASAREVWEDAVAQDLGERDAYDPKRIWRHPLAEIETRGP